LNERHAVLEEGNTLTFNEEYLVSLNARINRAHTTHRQQSAKLKMIQTEAFFYQDIIANANNPEQYLYNLTTGCLNQFFGLSKFLKGLIRNLFCKWLGCGT
jgi:hypothetical protein